jgi:hypothetical protein
MKEFNDELEKALPLIIPEASRSLELLKPVTDKLFEYLMTSELVERLTLQSQATYLAKGLIANGEIPAVAAQKAITCVKEIVRLSKEG